MKNRSRFFLILSVGVCALCAATPLTHAANLTFNSGTGTQSFGATVSGSASLKVQGTANFTIFRNGSFLTPGLNVPGTLPVNSTVGMTLQNSLNQSTFAYNGNPTGTGVVTQGNGGGGPHALTPGDPGYTSYTDQNSYDVDLADLTGLKTTTATINANTTLSFSVPLIGNVNLPIATTIAGSLQSIDLTGLNFAQSGSSVGADGTVSGSPAPPPLDGSRTYGAVAMLGDLSGNASANLPLTVTMSLGGQVLNTSFLIAVPIGPSSAALPGSLDMADLGDNGGIPGQRDLRATFSGSQSLVQLPLTLSSVVTIPATNQTFSTSIIGTATLMLKQSIFTVDIVNGAVNLSSVAYQLQDTVEDVLLPEPSSLLLASIAGVGLIVPVLRRRARRA